MNTAFILTGLPGSGKSHWTKKYIKVNPNSTCIVNLDKMREMLVGEYQNFPFDNSKYSKGLNKILINLKEESITSAIKNGLDIIIDETHITKKSRAKTINLISSVIQTEDIPIDTEYKIVIVYCTESKRNLEYRMKSPKGGNKDTWEGVINNMKSNFVIPSEDECDMIIEVML